MWYFGTAVDADVSSRQEKDFGISRAYYEKALSRLLISKLVVGV